MKNRFSPANNNGFSLENKYSCLASKLLCVHTLLHTFARTVRAIAERTTVVISIQWIHLNRIELNWTFHCVNNTTMQCKHFSGSFNVFFSLFFFFFSIFLMLLSFSLVRDKMMSRALSFNQTFEPNWCVHILSKNSFQVDLSISFQFLSREKLSTERNLGRCGRTRGEIIDYFIRCVQVGGRERKINLNLTTNRNSKRC